MMVTHREVSVGDKVYIEHRQEIATILEISLTEYEHPHNGDLHTEISELVVDVDGRIYHIVPDLGKPPGILPISMGR